MAKILIVEDDDVTRQVLHLYLCNLCANDCDEASTLSEALSKIETTHYDLIILDVWLGGDLGTGLISCAREWYPDKPPKIVVISAMLGADKLARDHKADYYLAKPFDLDSFDEILGNKNL
jgi:two-component system OmpR family response regulator